MNMPAGENEKGAFVGDIHQGGNVSLFFFCLIVSCFACLSCLSSRLFVALFVLFVVFRLLFVACF